MFACKGIKITPRVPTISRSFSVKHVATTNVIARQLHIQKTFSRVQPPKFTKDISSLNLFQVRRFATQSDSKHNNQKDKEQQNENKTQYEEIFTPGGPDPAPLRRKWGMEALSFAEGAIFLMLAYVLGYYSVKLYYGEDFQASAEEKPQEEEKEKEQTSDDNTVPVKNAVDDDFKEESYKYVIIGGGTAGIAAWEAIKENDPEGKILIIESSNDNPYLRPPLSKELWNSEDPDVRNNLNFKAFDGTPHNAYFHPESEYSDGRTTFLRSAKVVDMDVQIKGVLVEKDGKKTIINFDKLLIASGGQPRLIPGIDKSAEKHVSTFRTLADFRALHEATDNMQQVVIIGGGFLGSELACALAKKGKQTGMHVTQVFPENGLLGMVIPQYLSDYVTETIRKELNVDIQPGRLVKSVIKQPEGKVEVTLDDGSVLKTDHVIVAAGIRPNPSFAALTGIEFDEKSGGIAVNSELQARTDIYAAGDVASYYDVFLGRRRVEHHDHAVASGKHAGKNMTGARDAYSHLPFFWSDVGPFGFEAVGITDSNLKTVSVWEKDEKEPENRSQYKKGIVYYLNKEERVVGVVLWNHFGKVDDARRVIKRREVFGNPENLKNQISLEDAHH